ncbi:uncharacterized protein N7498_001010 [Penicillium cinerascens]|uniref:RRM domain-containing protein n=1 Tax=Penicillium cinerascens TaxID=70096 RepID=A0A9W9NFF2_9EURO|nr:uncharacterized protein N7498_001010 [Penicillium cinerascens]KAJ5218911.1 hypothetical protein N7498_001010 [Penicillium cinerascens]
MSLGNFLADETPATSSFGAGRPSGGMGFGGSGGFSDRIERGGYSIREPLDLPTEPPFTCHVGNLSFDATADDISDLFSGCGVTNVRIVEDKMTKAPKGFGYVEFETVEGLQKALDLSGTSLQGRTIRTSVAEPPKESRFEARDVDWTRRGPLPGPPERRMPERSSFGRNMDAASDAGSDRGGRRSNFEGDGKFRDFSNWERKGPLSPSAGPVREGGRPRDNDGPGSGFRRSSPAWGEGRSQDDGSRPPRPERAPPAPTAADMDNQWRARMRPDQAAEPSNPPSPAAPATRPKLNLAKRTVADAPTGPASGGDSKASPFGAARPIDTATREREVEQKRQLAIRQKKESDEKVKAEKAEKAKQKTPGTDSNKDGVDTPQGAKNFEILRRAGGDESGMPADEETVEETAAATPAAEEAQKKESANGNWRTAEAPAPTEDNDGWSTVGTKQRNNRRGQAGRA